MRLSRIILPLAAAATVIIAAASEPFNGIIQDPQGKPLKGAKIWTTDPDFCASSDKKGHWGLTDVQPTDTIHIRYKKQQYDIPVDSVRSMRVILFDHPKATATEDEDLIFLGDSFVKRRETARTTNGISGERLRRTGATDIMTALAGLVPGLEVLPGGRAIIRGRSSILSDTQPLYIVNSTIVPDFLGINISDVKSVEVLKDASFYGSQGSCGAIIVHTLDGTER